MSVTLGIVDLHKVRRVFKTRDDCRGDNIHILTKTWFCTTAWPSLQWSPFVRCFVYKEPEVKYMHISNSLEHCKK